MLHLMKRQYPKCHREQTVLADEISKSLPCKYCSSIISPNDRDSGYATRRHKTTSFYHKKK